MCIQISKNRILHYEVKVTNYSNIDFFDHKRIEFRRLFIHWNSKIVKDPSISLK